MALKVSGNNPKKFNRSQIKFYVFLIPFALFMMLPIIFIINHAFKPLDELFAFPPRFFVNAPTFDNFRNLFDLANTSGIPLSRYVLNSLIVTVAVVFFSIIISSMAGFVLSKKQFRGKKLFLKLITLH